MESQLLEFACQKDDAEQFAFFRTDGRPIARIALIGNFLPRRCGIATFTTDIFRAMNARYPEIVVDVYAVDDDPRVHAYPAEVTGTIDQDYLSSYHATAEAIEASGADIVWLQHEYGIFGGPAGRHVLSLLDRLSVPVVVTLHTVLEDPDSDQRYVTEMLARHAAKLVVMAEYGRDVLIDVYGASPSKIEVVEHGIPDRPFEDTKRMKRALGMSGRDVIMTFGLLSPGKGIETMIDALPAIVQQFPDVTYVVVGATHPHLVESEGEAYRESLIARAVEHGVGDHIRWVNAFLDTDDLLDYLAAADIYATPYLNPAQITSGTLAYAIGLGKAVVSTPYIHARELLAHDHGRIAPFGDGEGFAAEIIELLANPVTRQALRVRAYARGRSMIWPRFAEAMMGIFDTLRTSANPRRDAVRRAATGGHRRQASFASPRPVEASLGGCGSSNHR
ncbi:MAG: glycosyltransferase family 4 protein [Pseudomonadota bacterium]|nr:glycosyltransferase family 4 protein [Pseudomonadota bacterium]